MITGLNAVSEKIDEAFGRPPAFTSQPLSQADISVLDRIFGDVGYAVREVRGRRAAVRLAVQQAAGGGLEGKLDGRLGHRHSPYALAWMDSCS